MKGNQMTSTEANDIKAYIKDFKREVRSNMQTMQTRIVQYVVGIMIAFIVLGLSVLGFFLQATTVIRSVAGG